MTTKPEIQHLERLAAAHADAASRLKSAEADVAYFAKRLEESQEAGRVAYAAARVAARDLADFAAAEFLPRVNSFPGTEAPSAE